MKTMLEINKLSRNRFVNKEDFFELDARERNYYIGWSEGLEFIKNSIKEDESSCEFYVREMMKCLLKKNTSENIYTVDDFSFGWFDGYYESLKWFLEE